jgi:GTP-binding protein
MNKSSLTRLARVVIVGRTNVGKSTLFNRLANRKKALVADYEGVTRDFVTDTVTWCDTTFLLIDTGGIVGGYSDDPFLKQIREVARQQIESASVILFLVDSRVNATLAEQQVASLLHKTNKPVVLVLNKEDNNKENYENIASYQKLGFTNQFSISALHGKGITEVLDKLIFFCNKTEKVTALPTNASKYHIAIFGRPNVGKSSLMNLLVREQRCLVAPIAGTTREAISDSVQFSGHDILITDTPGVRRQKSVKEELEKLMVGSAFRAIDRADIVIFMIDCTSAELVDQELKLLFYLFEQYKGTVLLLNKEDLAEEAIRVKFLEQSNLYQHLLKKMPILTTSCINKKNIGKIMPIIEEVWDRSQKQVDAGEISRLCIQALRRRPLYHKTERLIIHAIKQIKVSPPTFLFIVNNPEWFGDSQRSFLENIIRKQYDFLGVPLKFIFRAGA